MSQTNGAENDGREERIRKLEEALAFGEHRGDQLSGEVERAFAEIKRLNERLDRIERRMSILRDEEGQTE